MRDDLLTDKTKIVWQDPDNDIIELENEHGVWWRMKLSKYMEYCLNLER